MPFTCYDVPVHVHAQKAYNNVVCLKLKMSFLLNTRVKTWLSIFYLLNMYLYFNNTTKMYKSYPEAPKSL